MEKAMESHGILKISKSNELSIVIFLLGGLGWNSYCASGAGIF